MPLTVREAEKSLKLLWEVYQAAADDGRDTKAVSQAISVLTAYISEIRPKTQLSVWDYYKSGLVEEQKTFESSEFGALRVVELLICTTTQKLGIYMDNVTSYSKRVHSLNDFLPIVISLLKPGSIAEKSGELLIGDQVLEINGHSLAQVSLQKARWLLESAYRSGRITLVVVNSGLAKSLKRSLTINSRLSRLSFTVPAVKPLFQEKPLPMHPKRKHSSPSNRSSLSSLHGHPMYTPSIGSRGSDHNLFSTTVELAAHLGMHRPQLKKRKAIKLHVMKGPKGLGINLVGGKGSRFGDMGIFIKEIEEDSWVYRDGRLRVGDEVLIVNGRLLVGATLKEVNNTIDEATNPLQFIIAREKSDESARSSFIRTSASYSEQDSSRPASQVSAQQYETALPVSPLAAVQSGKMYHATKENSETVLCLEASPRSLDRASIYSETLPRVISESSVHQSFEKKPEQNRVSSTLPPSGRIKGGLQPTTDKPNKVSNLMKFFKREKKDLKESSPKPKGKPSPFKTVPRASQNAPPKENTPPKIATKTKEKRRSPNDAYDEIRVATDLSPIPVEQLNCAFDEERDQIGTLEPNLPAMKTKQRNLSVASSTSFSSTNTNFPEDLSVVTNWAKLSTSSLHSGNEKGTPKMGMINTVLLYKPPKSQHKPLGFTLHGGRGSHFGDVGVHIKGIAMDSLAAADGRLIEGDELLEVNSHLVEGLPHKKVAQLIKSEYVKFGMISLKVKRSQGPESSRKPIRSPSIKGTPFQVILKKEPGVGLGMKFTGLTFDTNHFGIYIQSIQKQSPAFKCGKLQRGDQILGVNKERLIGIRIEKVHSLFGKLPPGPVTLKIMRPVNVAAVETLLDNIAASKAEQQFSIEVFGHDISNSKEVSILQPRPEVGPTIDQEILSLFENEELEVLEELEEKTSGISPSRSYIIDTSRHSRVDDTDESSSEEEESIRKEHEIQPERMIGESKSQTELLSKRPPQPDGSVRMGVTPSQVGVSRGRPPSASFSGFDVSNAALKSNLMEMQTLFPSTGTAKGQSSSEMKKGLTRHFSALSEASTHTASFIIEKVEIYRGPEGFGMTVLGGQVKAPLQGALVTAVQPYGAAAKQGIEKGDEIIEVNGISITGMTHSQVIAVLKETSGVVSLKIARSSPDIPGSQVSLSKTSSLSLPSPTVSPLPASTPPDNDKALPCDAEVEEEPHMKPVHPAVALVKEDNLTSSKESILETTDDELSSPHVIHEHIDESAKTSTLDGWRLSKKVPNPSDEEDEPPEETRKPFPAMKISVVSSSDDDSSSKESVADAKSNLTVTPSKHFRNSPTNRKSSVSVSKSSSGMSLVVSYTVDWKEEAESTQTNGVSGSNLEDFSAKKETDVAETVSMTSSGCSSPVLSEDVPKKEDVVPKGFQKHVFTIQKKPKSGLGITVVSSSGSTEGFHQIRRILPRSLADRDGQLRPGDRLVSVCGKSLRGLSHTAVLDEIRQTQNDCIIEILRDPLYASDNASSIYSFGSGSYCDSRLSIFSDESGETGSLKLNIRERANTFDLPAGRKLKNLDPEIRKSASPSVFQRLYKNMQDHEKRPLSMSEIPLVMEINRRPSETISPLATDSYTGNIASKSKFPSIPPDEPPSIPPDEPPSIPPDEPPSIPQDEPPSIPPDEPPSIPPDEPLSIPPDEPPSIPPDEPPSIPPDEPPSIPPDEPPSIPPDEPPSIPPDEPPSIPPDEPPSIPPDEPPSIPPDEPPSISQSDNTENKSEGGKPSLPKLRTSEGPFLVEVTKGFFSLGLTLGEDNMGTVIVRSISNKSPLVKEGLLKVDDWVLSINDQNCMTAAQSNDLLKSIKSKSQVCIVAMMPPKNVTGPDTQPPQEIVHQPPQEIVHQPPQEAVTQPPQEAVPQPPQEAVTQPPQEAVPQPPPEAVTQPPQEAVHQPPQEAVTQPPQEAVAQSPQIVISQEIYPEHSESELTEHSETDKSHNFEHIIEVEVFREGRPLGIVIEGGRDMPQQYVYVHTVVPGSPADQSKKLKVGDQLVMMGTECLVGLTWKEAQSIINSVPEKFLIIAQRKTASSQVSLRPYDSFVSIHSAVDTQQIETTPHSETHLSEIQAPVYQHSQTSLISCSPEALNNSGLYSTPEDMATRLAKENEEVFAIDLFKQLGKNLGFVIAGGESETGMIDIFVKKILPNSIAGIDGRLRIGDRLLYVNGVRIPGMTKPQAMDLLRATEDEVKLIIARRPLLTGSAINTPMDSKLVSRQESREASVPPTPPSMAPPTPPIVAPPTPPGMMKTGSAGRRGSRHKRSDSLSSLQRQARSDSVGSLRSITEEDIATGSGTLPRDIGSRVGVKLVELIKGPTGLGMKIVGGRNLPKPFIIRDVFPGGAAAKSGQIFPNDQILEVNGNSFENITHREGIECIKSLPLGKVQMVIRSGEFVKIS